MKDPVHNILPLSFCQSESLSKGLAIRITFNNHLSEPSERVRLFLLNIGEAKQRK